MHIRYTFLCAIVVIRFSQSVCNCILFEMVALKFLSVAFFSYFCFGVNGFFFTHLTDFKDFDSDCIANYLNTQHGFNIRLKLKDKKVKYCETYIRKLENSFYDSVEDLFCSKSYPQCIHREENHARDCTMNLIRRHRMSDVFFKAIAYNYFKKTLVKFSPNETCEGVLSVSRVSKCEHKEMSVELDDGYKSPGRLRSCLDDLFGAFKVDEIVFNKQDRIGFRSFGIHLATFFRQLNQTGKIFCSSTQNDLAIKYFGVREEMKTVYNQTQIDCFRKSFGRIYGNSFFDNEDSISSRESSEEDLSTTCEEIMQEQVENVITIDLFGFTDAYRRVKSCIVERNAEEKLIDRVIVLPVVARFMNLPIAYFDQPMKKYIKYTLSLIHI